MDKNFARRNVRMGILLTLVIIVMGLIAWLWTVLFLQSFHG